MSKDDKKKKEAKQRFDAVVNGETITNVEREIDDGVLVLTTEGGTEHVFGLQGLRATFTLTGG